MKKRIISLLALMILLSYAIGTPVYAFENYDTKPVYGDEYSALKKIVDGFTLVGNPEKDRMIKCFAISENGQIALAFDGEYAQIDVYTSDGTFLYGYSFLNNGNAFSVFFENEELSIYHAKDGYVASFDAKGNCTLVHKVIYTKTTSEAYQNDFYRPPSGQVGELFYTAEKTLSLLDYSRFTVKDESGDEIVIYQVSRGAFTQIILSAIAFTGTVIGVFFCVKKYREVSQE